MASPAASTVFPSIYNPQFGTKFGNSFVVVPFCKSFSKHSKMFFQYPLKLHFYRRFNRDGGFNRDDGIQRHIAIICIIFDGFDKVVVA